MNIWTLLSKIYRNNTIITLQTNIITIMKVTIIDILSTSKKTYFPMYHHRWW